MDLGIGDPGDRQDKLNATPQDPELAAERPDACERRRQADPHLASIEYRTARNEIDDRAGSARDEGGGRRTRQADRRSKWMVRVRDETSSHVLYMAHEEGDAGIGPQHSFHPRNLGGIDKVSDQRLDGAVNKRRTLTPLSSTSNLLSTFVNSPFEEGSRSAPIVTLPQDRFLPQLQRLGLGRKWGQSSVLIHIVVSRCTFGARLLDKAETPYDAVVLRPTIVFGLSSSYYGSLFDLAERSRDVLTIFSDPDAIMHSCHVDDCADAYVALAENPDRRAIANQAYNISNQRYETAREIGEALARSYQLDLAFQEPTREYAHGDVYRLFNYWQWVGSGKIRAMTGWHEKRAMFADGIDQYRMAYEATR